MRGFRRARDAICLGGHGLRVASALASAGRSGSRCRIRGEASFDLGVIGVRVFSRDARYRV